MAVVLPPSFLQNVAQAAGHTARGDRLTLGASFTPGAAAVSGRTGILPGPTNGMGELSLINATTVRVQAFRGVVQGTQDSRQGQYTITNDAAVDLAIGAQASGVTRRDLIVAYVRDSAYTPTTQDDWLLTVIPGTAVASNPQLPATPINALLIGEVLVAPTGGTNQLTSYSPRTAAVGGIIPVVATDTTAGVFVDQFRSDPSRGIQRWSGSAWIAPDLTPTIETGWSYLGGNIYGPISAPYAPPALKRFGTKAAKLQGAFTHITQTFQAGAAGGPYNFMQLPAGMAPAATQEFTTAAYTGSTNTWMKIILRGDGILQYVTPVDLGTGFSISLNGIEWDIAA